MKLDYSRGGIGKNSNMNFKFKISSFGQYLSQLWCFPFLMKNTVSYTKQRKMWCENQFFLEKYFPEKMIFHKNHIPPNQTQAKYKMLDLNPENIVA